MNKKNFLLMGLAAALFGCANPIYQVIVDAKVDELCAKDGKSIVYEREEIPLNKAKISLSKELLEPGDTHYWQVTDTRIESAETSATLGIVKVNGKLIRVRDSKMLGEYTYYFRRGGDFLPGHPSAYFCKTAALGQLAPAIFASSGAKND
jgi:hypothetical protein